MSRIRSIKPEFWTSEQVVECSPTARLLFIGFWNFADDNGVLPASAKLLKMLVFPGDDFRVDQVRGFADELLNQGLLAEFGDDTGRAYWFVTGWKKHQKIDKPSNKYPAPPLEFRDSPLVRQPFVERSPSTLRAFAEPSATERSGEEWRGREEEGKGGGEERAPADAAAAATPGATTSPVSAIPVNQQPDTAKPSKPVKAKKARALEPLPASPDWLPADAWQRFIRHRQNIKHPLTIDAAELTLRDLNTARAFGHDPVALIADAVRNGWRGCVYPDRHHQPKHSALPGGGRAPRKAVAAPAVATTAAGAEFATILNAMNNNRPVIEGEVIAAD